MKTRQEIQRSLLSIKNDLNYLEQNDAPGNHEAIDNKMHDVVATVASINDDLLEMLRKSDAEIQTETIQYRDISNLRKLICDCKDYVQQISNEDLAALRTLADDLWYRKQLVDFIKHLDDAMPGDDASEEEINKFYSTDWTITFGDKSLKMYNCATLYGDIYESLKEVLYNEV